MAGEEYRKFDLQMTPGDIVEFDEKRKDQAAILEFSNPTDRDKALKVKCSNNLLFPIHPPVCVIKAKGKAEVKVHFNPPDGVLDKKQHLSVYSTDMGTCTQPRKAFDEVKSAKNRQGRKRIRVHFKGTEEKKEGKKEENKA